ncbi:protein FAR1-RELATED SEQUENCE 7-like isoform X2 [Rhodamnia argentea]|uniref:Protein FAR1-RELATED SEQUENCE n=1 Tax=Rhodamnia argentea TaxID=178133 RepID=A0ABM3HHM9_9MYRT|nr:protein FAR1-RELATED SEQUENCE 7-like isoform X2 [Rhodamnia argentea]
MGVGEEEFEQEPYVGLEFNTADDARIFYGNYASRVGFKIRSGQLYRSRVDGSVCNRRFVCWKEGFQINSRTGCPAFIRVKKSDSGKWVLDQFAKDHNHDLDACEENHPANSQCKSSATTAKVVDLCRKPRIKQLDVVNNGCSSSSSIASAKRVKPGANEGQVKLEPFVGLKFDSANKAYQHYDTYAGNVGFRVRIGQLFRSKNDGSITSRRFVCSKEGFQHPSRVGCGAFMRIKRHDNGRWIVDRYQLEHNHELEVQMKANRGSASRKFLDEINETSEKLDIAKKHNGSLLKKHHMNNIGSDWYTVLHNYFQNRQAEDIGFFCAVDVQMGCCRSLFWADGRSRFSCSQFGDAIIFDTSYKQNNYVVPFATFVGVNHHKQAVLLGCALVADESTESFIWLFETWLRAMSGCHPKSIIADQDDSILQAIAQVFPSSHHRFSMWQIKAKECEHLSPLSSECKYEYEKCVYQSHTVGEFDAAWDALLSKYGLRENAWLKEMYEKRENWVPLYLRGTFFAGIPIDGGLDAFFYPYLNSQTSLEEFVVRYEQGLEQRRGSERKEDYNSFNLQAFLQTNEPMEEQCRRLYTLSVFKVFQRELLQSYSYLGAKIHEQGAISRYLIRKCGNENEKHIVTFCTSNLDVSCGCQMFESEGVLCRHALRLFQILDIRELPSRYILHRWTRSAEYGTIRDFDSGGSSHEIKAKMIWSLREIAAKYVEFGATSFEKYKLAYEIMHEGGRKLCWQRLQAQI